MTASGPTVCPGLSDPQNGLVTMTGTNVGDQATYTCNENFELEGEPTRTCIEPGIWDGTEPACIGMLFVSVKTLYFKNYPLEL